MISPVPKASRRVVAAIVATEILFCGALVVPTYWLGGRYLLGIIAGFLIAGVVQWRSSRIARLRGDA